MITTSSSGRGSSSFSSGSAQDMQSDNNSNAIDAVSPIEVETLLCTTNRSSQ